MIGGTDSGSVTEDVDPDMDTLLETGGVLTISDADAGEESFQAGTVTGSYGSVTIDAAGNWTYVADNSQAAIQALDVGELLTDTLSVSAFDGTMHTIVITLNGAEDAAVLGGTTTAVVAEDGTLSDGGTLTISDVDSSDNPVSWNDEALTAGDNGYGQFEISNGTWTYTLDNGNASVQALDVGETLTDTFTFTASDGSTQLVTVTIEGAEDAPEESEITILSDPNDVPTEEPNNPSESDEPDESNKSSESDDSENTIENPATPDNLPEPESESFPRVTNGDLPPAQIDNFFAPDNDDIRMRESLSLNNDSAIHLLNLRLNDPIDVFETEDLIPPNEIYSLNINYQDIVQDLENIRNQTDEQHSVEAQASLAAAVSFSAGFVSYLLRAGSLLSSMFSVIPVWKSIDPLPIINQQDDDDAVESVEDQENKGVETMFGRKEQ